MALAMPPSEVVRLLNKFFRVVVDVVDRAGGIVNKFEGDAALCVFGAPMAGEDPAGDALRAARELTARLERDVPEVGFGIGVSAGAAVAGNVGSEERFEYTVIGDPVNEAARLCDLAKDREQTVLASGSALDQASAEESERWTLTESTVLRGRLDATRIAVPRERAAVEAPARPDCAQAAGAPRRAAISTIRSTRSSNSMPAASAAIGKSDVSVRPGIELTSRTWGPVGVRGSGRPARSPRSAEPPRCAAAASNDRGGLRLGRAAAGQRKSVRPIS